MFEKVSGNVNHAKLNWIRHCAVCGSSFPPVKWLCLDCLNRLKSLYIPHSYMIRMQSHFRHLRLVDWKHDNHYFIQILLNRLKGFQRSHFFSMLAFEFFTRMIQLPSVIQDRPFVFIPCPSKTITHPLWDILDQSIFSHLSFIKFRDLFNKKREKEKDHSYYWAEALQAFTKSPICSVLSHSSSNSGQKRKSLLDRKKKTFIMKSTSAVPLDHQIVFVDDVVTSGSTAMSAYKALGKPKHFMVWSIFWRKYYES